MAGSAPRRARCSSGWRAYAERELASGTPLAAMTRHMLGLYAGQPGARAYRQRLSEGARGRGRAAVLRAAGSASRREARAPPPAGLVDPVPKPGRPGLFLLLIMDLSRAMT